MSIKNIICIAATASFLAGCTLNQDNRQSNATQTSVRPYSSIQGDTQLVFGMIRPQPEEISRECDETFSKPYKNSNAKEAFELLKKSSIKKDEYETSDQYEARSQESLKNIMHYIQTKTGNKYIVFDRNIDEVWTEYNADAQQLTIGSNLSANLVYKFHRDNFMLSSALKHFRLFNDKIVKIDKGSYIGSNAFGVRKEIYKTDVTLYQFAFEDGRSTSFDDPWPAKDKKTIISMTPDEARKVRSKMKVVFVSSLLEPYIAEENNHSYPKIDDPFETTEHKRAVILNLECAAIVNSSNGSIVKILR